MSNAVFNVRAFGAKGDGVTDDSPAFEGVWMATHAVVEIMFVASK